MSPTTYTPIDTYNERVITAYNNAITALGREDLQHEEPLGGLKPLFKVNLPREIDGGVFPGTNLSRYPPDLGVWEEA